MEPRRKLAAFLGGPPPASRRRISVRQLPLSGEMARAQAAEAGRQLGSWPRTPQPRAPSAQSRRLNADAGTLSPLPGLRLFLCFCQGEPGELGAARWRGRSVPLPSGDTVGSCFESRVKNYTRLRPHVLRLPLHCPRLASRFLPAPDGHSRLLRADRRAPERLPSPAWAGSYAADSASNALRMPLPK